jgi:serine/threonine-protein kinase HipA
MVAGLLEVRWWDGRRVGRLTAPGPVYFEYDPQWLDTGYDLSPISLPFVVGAQRKKDPFFNGLPGVLADCLPDTWGEAVMKRVFEQRKLGRVTPLKALAWIGSGGMGALSFHPEFPQDQPSRAWKTVRAEILAREARAVVRGAPADLFPRIAASGGSVGGAWPKALVALERNGSLAYGGAATDLPEATFHILKFDQSEDGSAARCEHAYALMAGAAGIQVNATRLLPANDPHVPQRRHLLIERFDVLAAGRRRHIHTLCGLIEKPARQIDYVDFLRAALRVIVRPDEREFAVRAILRRLIFNVLAANDDDHGKNHAFMLIEAERDWRLTPAYDITFSPNEGPHDRGLTVQGHGGVPSREQLAALARDVGVGAKEFGGIFAEVAEPVERWPQFADRAKVNASARHRIQSALADRQREVG